MSVPTLIFSHLLPDVGGSVALDVNGLRQELNVGAVGLGVDGSHDEARAARLARRDAQLAEIDGAVAERPDVADQGHPGRVVEL